MHVAARLGELRLRGPQRRLVVVGEHHAHALVGERGGQRAADAAGRAGDDGDVPRLDRTRPHVPSRRHPRRQRSATASIAVPRAATLAATGDGVASSDRAVPLPVDPAGARAGDDAQPHRVQRAPHQLRPRRQAHRAARRLLRGPRRRRRRADHHRGALHPPDRLAVREADPRLPPRRHPRLPDDHRRGPPPPRADLRPDQPQRRPGQLDVLPPAGVGAVAPSPTRCSARCPRRSPRPRSTRSSPATRSSPSTAPRAASTASSCSAATRRSCAASSRRRRTSAPTSTAARSTTAPGCCCEIVAAVRGVIGNRLALGVRICGDELIDGGTTIDDAVEVARMVEASGQVDYINTSIGVATASLFMIEASMHIPPGLRDVHPVARSARPSTCRWSASAGSRIRCRPSGRWPKGTATSSASCAARSPTPTSPPRPAPGPPTTSACA